MARDLRCVKCGKQLGQVFEFSAPYGFDASENRETVMWSAVGMVTERYNSRRGITSISCTSCGTKQGVVKRKGRTYIRKYPDKKK